MLVQVQHNKLLIRCDASTLIGTGHVARCLELAVRLRELGFDICFAARDLPGNQNKKIKDCGFRLFELSPSADAASMELEGYAQWLEVPMEHEIDEMTLVVREEKPDAIIIDHYSLASDWSRAVFGNKLPTIVIDDLANRELSADLVINQNLGKTSSIAAYDGLCSASTEFLLGPKFAILRPEFAAYRHESLLRRRANNLQTIAVSFGGGDVNNYSKRFFDLFVGNRLFEKINLLIILGKNAPAVSQDFVLPAPFCANYSDAVKVFVDIQNMAELLTNVDLVIGAGGSSSWERCCLGVPTFLTCVAENQKPIYRALENLGAVSGFDFELETDAEIMAKLAKFFEATYLRQIGQNAANLVDGLGASRVAERISEMVLT